MANNLEIVRKYKREWSRRWRKEKPLVASFSDHKSEAVSRGRRWALTFLEFHALRLQNCFYCGKPGPSGLDRKNNRHGYTQKNTVPCCRSCNSKKKDRTLAEFRRGPYKGRYLLKLDSRLKERFVAAAKSEGLPLAKWIRRQCQKAIK
jgi:5-methylcytosine-specific restriction endonuclease McrA